MNKAGAGRELVVNQLGRILELFDRGQRIFNHAEEFRPLLEESELEEPITVDKCRKILKEEGGRGVGG